MRHLAEAPEANVADPNFLQEIHRAFYSHLPPEHLFTHTGDGFTDFPVLPGQLRDHFVGVGRGDTLGPAPEDVPSAMNVFNQAYDPENYHGDERLIAMAASHHRLAWIHPFRDGNGRTCRLFSGLMNYHAYAGIGVVSCFSGTA